MRSLLPIVFICLSCSISSCKKENKEVDKHFREGIEQKISYAKGFEITLYKTFKIITVSKAWPNSDKTFNYALVQRGTQLPDSITADAVIETPVEKIVVTSTTHIPALELLGVTQTLKGFPNLDYISSETVRKHIKNGAIKELGQNESINTESTINLNPDVLVSFGVDGENKALNSIKRAGIPVIYNGDWVETTPLGQAEWIKFFAALYDKEAEADSIFNRIEGQYRNLKTKAAQAKSKPTVLSGAMFKDVWYLPKGDSWAAQLVADAHADYIYKETRGTGSAALSIEEVLNTAQNADFWISPNSFETYSELSAGNAVYKEFKAFKDHKIYGFGSAKGATGGLLYYELAPSRPDWVLADLVAIFHPELTVNYKPHFFKPLD
ncbi:ABC transporter substrate-binding protein [Leeuwenhoekiella sp. NPDC079379]|uniref:ABC transporter substrate-binding protein n=1 Tax=Leeuwenhoekiella sp. NPDC079379 TaxID=3364122 RepID=UPI0037CC431B